MNVNVPATGPRGDDDKKERCPKMMETYCIVSKCTTAGAWSTRVREMRRRSMVKMGNCKMEGREA